MKNKLPHIILSIIISITVFIIIKNNFDWNNSDKVYATCRINGKKYSGAGPSTNKYVYQYLGNKYEGIEGTKITKQQKYYIIQISINEPDISKIVYEIPINPEDLLPQPPEGWTECPINEDGTIKEKYKRKNDPWYLKKTRYVVGEAMDTSMRYIYRFKWRYASVPNVEIGKHYMLKINADNLKQYELASTVPIDTAKLQIQTNGGWEECPITKEGAIKDKFKK